MKKITNLNVLKSKIRLVCWDLDGTLFDTEIMWFNMDNIISSKYGNDFDKDKYSKYSEEIAANAYKTYGYRCNADKVLKYFKDNNICQILVNECELTNKTMLKNDLVNKTFSFKNFDNIVSEKSFDRKVSMSEMYKKAIEISKINNEDMKVAICDMPFELKAAKDNGFITIWAKNKEYPFTKDELNQIKEVSDYYVEDFKDLMR